MRKYRNTTETWRHQSCGPGVHSKYWLVQSWQQILKTFLFQWPISPALQLWPSPLHNHPPISPNYTDWSNEATVKKSTVSFLLRRLKHHWHNRHKPVAQGVSGWLIWCFDDIWSCSHYWWGVFFFHLPEENHIFQSFSPSLIQYIFFSYSLPPFTSSFL